jgi:CheY-like chemotaxis protein
MNFNSDSIENSDSDIVFSDEELAPAPNEKNSWKILIVDDEPDLHTVTELALRHFSFEGKSLSFLHAYSGKQAEKQITEHPDTALILLDVVMETEDAGLLVAKHIRETLDNHMVRILLRTGQPGVAPERDVIVNYEINEYRTKDELTAQRLFTTFIAALRNYRDLRMIERNRRGLEKIVGATGTLFEMQSIEHFMSSALTELKTLLGLGDDEAFYCPATCFSTADAAGKLNAPESCENKSSCAQIPAAILHDTRKTDTQRNSLFFHDGCATYLFIGNKKSNMICLHGRENLSQVDRHLLEVFCSNIPIAIDNISLRQEIEDTQKEVVYRMGATANDARAKPATTSGAWLNTPGCWR